MAPRGNSSSWRRLPKRSYRSPAHLVTSTRRSGSSGPFEHVGPLWHVSHAVGTLNEDTITAADVKLVEGPHGKPDDLTVDLVFDHVDANVLLTAKKNGSAANADVPFTVDRAPDMLIAAKVAAHELTYRGIHSSDVTFSGSLKPGRIAVDVISLDYLGASFRASGQIDAVPGLPDADGGHVTANVDMITWTFRLYASCSQSAIYRSSGESMAGFWWRQPAQRSTKPRARLDCPLCSPWTAAASLAE